MLAEGSRARAGLAVVAAALITCLPAAPAPAADFYAGKTIDFLIGGDVGGGYDIYARASSPAISPASFPAIRPSFPRTSPAPAAGGPRPSSIAVAPKDGTMIGAVFPGAIMGPLLDDRAQPLFDPTKFQYLASADNATRVCITHERSRIKSFEDALTAEGHHGRERGRRLDPRLRQHAQEDHRRDVRAGRRATRAPPTSFSRWSAARSTACAASIGRA